MDHTPGISGRCIPHLHQIFLLMEHQQNMRLFLVLLIWKRQTDA